MVSVLISDSRSEQRFLAAVLRKAGYTPIETTDGGEVLREVMDMNPRLVLTAHETPPVEGVDFLPLVRRLTDVPIMVIGPDSEDSMVQALLYGADAYIKRPIDPDDLLARIQALLRRWDLHRHLSREQGRSQSADLSRLQDTLADLTPVEVKILSCLLDRSGGVVSREELMLDVWGDRNKASSLRFHISQLRQKLGKGALGEILNLKGIGYQLVLRPAAQAGRASAKMDGSC